MSGVEMGRVGTLLETEVIGAGQYRHSLSKKKQHHTKYVLERTHIYAHTYNNINLRYITSTVLQCCKTNLNQFICIMKRVHSKW